MVKIELTWDELQQLKDCINYKLNNIPASSHIGFMRLKEKIDYAKPVSRAEEKMDRDDWLFQAGIYDV